jgi:hypothetical protein
MELQYDCYIKGGALFIKNRELYLQELSTLQEDKEYTIVIRVKRKPRSNGQNKYYWGVVVPLILRGLKDAGFDIHSKDDAHDIIKLKFLKTNIENISGEFMVSFKSTKEMSTSEFKDFIEHLQIWASEYLNVYIPSPNEKLDIEFI